MIGTYPIILVLQLVLFAGWVFEAFRVLFHLRRRAEARTGRFLNGPFTFLAVARDWMTDPEQAQRRRQFYLFTAALVVVTIGTALMDRTPPVAR